MVKRTHSMPHVVLRLISGALQMSIPKLTMSGAYVLTVNATDEDSRQNGQISYSLLTTGTAFSIQKDTGKS